VGTEVPKEKSSNHAIIYISKTGYHHFQRGLMPDYKLLGGGEGGVTYSIGFDVNLKIDLVWEFFGTTLACQTHVTASCCRKLQVANSR